MAPFVYLVGILLMQYTNAREQDLLTLDKSVLDPVLENRVCLQSNVAVDTIVSSPSQCMMFCSLNDACKSFSFTPGTGRCRVCSDWDGDFDDETGALMYVMIGHWNPWAAWSTCSFTCGGGVRTRIRTCDTVSGLVHCFGTTFEENSCHNFSCTPHARTCAELASRGLTDSSNVDIDPTETGSTSGLVAVHCDLNSEPGKAITVMHHDQESRTGVQGFESCGSYSVVLNYTIGFEKAIAIAELSTMCSQRIKWECLHSEIHLDGGPGICTYWKNRHQAISSYFTGPHASGKYCHCGQIDMCDEPGVDCNCDLNDYAWRSDEGNITDKNDLPVYSFNAADTGGFYGVIEQGYHIIGPLLCW